MELEEHPQGRLRPYLMAPMTMTAVDRSLFTSPGPIEFAFLLNGETAATVTAAIKYGTDIQLPFTRHEESRSALTHLGQTALPPGHPSGTHS